MLIGRKMVDALNAQVGREFSSSMQYVVIGSWFKERGLDGFGEFFIEQAAEEYQHGMKMVQYLGDVGAHVAMPGIEKPKDSFASVTKVLEQFLSSEEEITRAIHELVALARSENDASAFEFLQWYVAEQREEMASANSLLEKVKLLGEDQAILLDGTLGRGGGGNEG